MASSGDPSTFTFTLDAFPDYIIGNKTKKVLASIALVGADDNYDDASKQISVEDGVVRRWNYNYDNDGNYIARARKTKDDWYYIPVFSYESSYSSGTLYKGEFIFDKQYISNEESKNIVPYKTYIDAEF